MRTFQTWVEMRKNVPLLGDMREDALQIAKTVEQSLTVMNARLLVIIELLEDLVEKTASSGGDGDGGN